MQRPTTQLLLIRQQYQSPQRGSTQMRAVADVRTIVFMPGVKTESHPHPSRMPKRHPPNVLPAKISVDALNCYFAERVGKFTFGGAVLSELATRRCHRPR